MNFRNAILNLYNSKVHKRKTGFAIIAVPPFFSNPENEDVYQMKSIVKKIIFSFIASFRTDSIMTDKFNFISDPNYFSKIDEYLDNNKELSIITNELNAEKLVVLQTIGNPVKFDLQMQLYDPKRNNELEKIEYLTKIEFNKVPFRIDLAYDTMKTALLKSINVNTKNSTKDFNKPSEFYEVIPKKLGVEFNGMQSLFFKDKANLFLGNNLRPAVELATYFSTAIYKVPVSFNLSFLYDFGDHKEYQKFGDSTESTVTIYGRNLNFVIKGYIPFNARIKNNWRGYLGAGFTFIDIHTVTSSSSIGSFNPGWVATLGTEYNFNSKLYVDVNARLLTSSIKFKTFDEVSDSITEGHYTVFYLSMGLGYEF